MCVSQFLFLPRFSDSQLCVMQYHPEWALNDPFWVFGGHDNQSQLQFSALLWGLRETKMYGLVRLLLPKSTQPRICLLIPRIGENRVEKGLEVGLLVQVGCCASALIIMALSNLKTDAVQRGTRKLEFPLVRPYSHFSRPSSYRTPSIAKFKTPRRHGCLCRFNDVARIRG